MIIFQVNCFIYTAFLRTNAILWYNISVAAFNRMRASVCSVRTVEPKDPLHQSNSNKIPTDEIVELLKSRYILYENAQSDSKEPFYFLPCLLYPDHEIEQDHSLLDFLAYPPILLIPEAGYVPLGPFPATVVKLSQSSHWKLASRPRFRNRIRFYFQLPSERKLDVELRALSTHLEFRIRHNASKLVKSHLIPECLRQLREVFDNVLKFYPHTRQMEWVFGFYCPHATDRCPHPIKCSNTDIIPQDGICSQEGCIDEAVDLEDNHKCWFTVSKNNNVTTLVVTWLLLNHSMNNSLEVQ